MEWLTGLGQASLDLRHSPVFAGVQVVLTLVCSVAALALALALAIYNHRGK